MSTHTESALATPSSGLMGQPSQAPQQAAAPHALANYQIIRRNGAVVPFEPNKIAVALMKAFWPCMAPRALRRPACARWWTS